jgi:hypothetical protein
VREPETTLIDFNVVMFQLFEFLEVTFQTRVKIVLISVVAWLENCAFTLLFIPSVDHDDLLVWN